MAYQICHLNSTEDLRCVYYGPTQQQQISNQFQKFTNSNVVS